MVLWNFFSEGTSNGVASLLARGAILTKVVMPRHVMVYAAILNALLTFAISLVVLAGSSGGPACTLTIAAVAFPVMLLDLVLLTLGVALFLAPLYVRYHDVGYLWGIAVQVGFWLTPIIYLEVMIPERWRWLVTYNPMARIIGDSRQSVIYGLWPDCAMAS